MNDSLEELAARVKAEPNNPEILKELGNLYFREGDYDQAIEQYQASLRIDPSYYKSLYNLGNTYYKIGDFDKAVSKWQDAIKARPDFDHAYFNLGYYYFQRGYMREAIKSLKEASRISPDAPDTHHYLGLAYHQTGQLNEAIVEFKKAIELEETDPDYMCAVWSASDDEDKNERKSEGVFAVGREEKRKKFKGKKHEYTEQGTPICDFCKKVGNVKRECPELRKKKKKKDRNDKRQNQRRPEPIASVVYAIGEGQHRPFVVHAKIEGTPFNVFLDGGAVENCISTEFLKRVCPSIKLQPCNKQLIGVKGQPCRTPCLIGNSSESMSKNLARALEER